MATRFVVTGKRILVCGGRYYRDRAAAFAAFDRAHAERGIAVIIHGKCHLGGADLLADEWAKARGIPVEAYPVDHDLDGPWPGAGPKRNGRMLKQSKPDGVIALPGHDGTDDMCKQAKKAEVPVWRPYG